MSGSTTILRRSKEAKSCGFCRRSPLAGVGFVGTECPHTPVPQFDRTVLRLCLAVQLGPLALRVNGPSNSARRRGARPHRLSSTRTSRVSTRRGWVGKCPSLGTSRVRYPIPPYKRGWIKSLRALGESRVSARLGGRVRIFIGTTRKEHRETVKSSLPSLHWGRKE